MHVSIPLPFLSHPAIISPVETSPSPPHPSLPSSQFLHPHSILQLPLGSKAYKEIGVLCCIVSVFVVSPLPNLCLTIQEQKKNPLATIKLCLSYLKRNRLIDIYFIVTHTPRWLPLSLQCGVSWQPEGAQLFDTGVAGPSSSCSSNAWTRPVVSEDFQSVTGSAGCCPGLLPPEASPCCVGGVNVVDSDSMHSVTSSSWREQRDRNTQRI